MSDLLLTVDRLGKCYTSYHSNLSRFAAWFGIPVTPVHEYWAIKDISFSLRRGEAFGLIGKNGAGKSTLLKLITGTIRQTTGSIDLRGRASAILELGLGFNPDFTGAQNVVLAGGMMGLSSDEIASLLPEIKSFSELGRFFDDPLRIYSSGMQARLAFALATCKQPDLLIIDEALSVGDMAFQRKCFRRIERFLETGTSLLFVSHQLESVRRLCRDAIFLKQGHIALFGKAKDVCDCYEKDDFGSEHVSASAPKRGSIDANKQPQADEVQHEHGADRPVAEHAYGSGDAIITNCWIEDDEGRPINTIRNGAPFTWCFLVKFGRDVENPVFGMRLKAIDGVDVYSTNTEMLGRVFEICSAGTEMTLRFKLVASLAPNVYFLNAGVSERTQCGIEFLHRRVDAKSLRIVNREASLHAEFGGIADLNASVSSEVRQLKVNKH